MNLRYAIGAQEVRRILGLMSSVLGIRIVFYDIADRKLKVFDLTGDTGYCRTLRANPAFERRCVQCDGDHLVEARRRRKPVIYTCHHGLLESIIPLFDENGVYLGAIVFGQIRSRDGTVPRQSASLRRLYDALPTFDGTRLSRVVGLMEYLCRYIMQNELIASQSIPWTERVKSYIMQHLDEKLTIHELAAVAGCSRSTVSHRFREQFGVAPQSYIQKARMRRAEHLLRKGCGVKETAFRLGYCDEFHFSKMFKAHAGKSPREFAGS